MIAAAGSSSIANRAAPRNGTAIVSHEASPGFVSNALRWSSGKWWKTRGMATVRPDQAGLDSYVDPDECSMGGSVARVKATFMRFAATTLPSQESRESREQRLEFVNHALHA
jgi:hypothetical protein